MAWKKIKKFLPIIGIALFVYILVKLDFREIFGQILEVNKFYLLLALALTGIFLMTQTLKWHFLARKQKIKVPFLESFKINLMADFYGLVTPGKLGSVMRADYLKKYANVGKGFSNFVIDKIFDLCSLLFLAIFLGLIVLGEKISSVIWILALAFAVLILLFLIFYKKERSKIILRLFYRKFVPNRFKEKAKTIFNSFYEDLPKKGALAQIFALNLFAWIVNYFVAYVIAMSLGIEIKFIYLLAIYPIATLVAQIPITISGLGTREATLIWLFGIFGVEAVKVFSMSLLAIFIMAIIPSLVAIFFILKKKSKNEIHNIKKS